MFGSITGVLTATPVSAVTRLSLRIEAVMDDVEAPDVYFTSFPAVAEAIGAVFEAR